MNGEVREGIDEVPSSLRMVCSLWARFYGITANHRHGRAEVYSFLRSPYRDLALYDAIAQVGSFNEPEVGRLIQMRSMIRFRCSIQTRNQRMRRCQCDGSRGSGPAHVPARYQSSATLPAYRPRPFDPFRRHHQQRGVGSGQDYHHAGGTGRIAISSLRAVSLTDGDGIIGIAG